MNEESTCSPFARMLALLLWTGLIGGSLAVNFAVVPKAAHAYESVNVALPVVTTTIIRFAELTKNFWWAALGGYLVGVIAIGSRLFDGVMKGVIVLESLAIALASSAYLVGILLPALRH